MMNKLISYFGTFTPGADGAVGAFQFEYLTSLGFAALVIFAGRAIVRRSHVLRKFAIPAPVISGLLFSVLIAIFKGTGILAISFDTNVSQRSAKMNRVEISLYDVVKSTGEVKDTFKFQYGGRRYDRLSLSEKIRAGMEVSELMKRLTGRNYPVFVDNMESVDDLANVRPTGQIIMAKCVSGAALQVKPVRPIVFAEQRAA